MDKEKQELLVLSKQAGIRKRPLLCQVVLISALTYFLIPALFFLAGLIYSGKIIDFIREYYRPGDISANNYMWVTGLGSFLYFTAVAGILLFLLNKRIGFYIFFIASVAIFSLDLIFLEFDWIRYLTHSGFIFILGIAHFSRRCYARK
jgi:hypothetical protein